MDSGLWHLVERTRPDRRDPAAHATAITDHLVSSGVEGVISFARAFGEALDELYDWELWGAAYFALGGCSDDDFEYLRCWIIGEGLGTFDLARADPEALFLTLLDGASDPDARWDELKLLEGEWMLYAAGRAHEQLTGVWLPTSDRPASAEPNGQRWEEDDLPDRFPRLLAVMPEGWWSDDPGLDFTQELRFEALRGIEAFTAGDHETAAEILDPIVNEQARWALITQVGDLRVDVAYVSGICRLARGDVEGAGRVFHLVENDMSEADHVRRALAQVELAQGDLDEAAKWVVDSPDAFRLDRVLVAKLMWRRREHQEAVRRAFEELSVPPESEEDPWDVAGSIQQVGRILADAEEMAAAEVAVETMKRLLVDAPDSLPLLRHLRLLEASVSRLRGHVNEALAALSELVEVCDGTDHAESLRERARTLTALDRVTDATADYRRAVYEFEKAGELWDAAETRREAGL